MLDVYVPNGSSLERRTVVSGDDVPDNAVWFDLINPAPGEDKLIEGRLGIAVPTREEMQEIEVSSRLYTEHHARFMTATLMCNSDTVVPRTTAVTFILAKHCLVTVRYDDPKPFMLISNKLTRNCPQSTNGEAVLMELLDAVVDQYVYVESEVQRDLEEIEEQVFADGGHVSSQDIYKLKREVLEFKRAVKPLEHPLSLLVGEQTPIKSREARLLLRDVADHLGQAIDNAESQDRLLSDILAAHLAQVGVKQNADMRKISAWVAIAAVPTMIAGVYGMNFEYMPELTASIPWRGEHLRIGYFVVLAVMVLACWLLYRTFRRSGWL